MNVLIVDDHPLFRRGLCSYFASHAQYQVVAQAGNGDEALTCLRSGDIELVLLDVDLPQYNGFELLSIIRHDYADLLVVMLTLHDEIAYARRAFELGANAYLLKDDAEEKLETCLASICVGQRFCSLESIEQPANQALVQLSVTERQIFTLVAAGKSSFEISAALGISVRTVDNHRANIAKKLGLRGTNALLKFALQHASADD